MAQNAGFTVWLTGMHGTGKTTLANYLTARLRQVDRPVEVLDHDEVAELWELPVGDTKDERNLMVRRMGAMAEMLTRHGVAAICAAVSPHKSAREENRRTIGRYVEVYVDCPTDELIKRDSTGRYKKALQGELPNFIGITEPYEPPNAPEVTIYSNKESVEEGGRKIFQALLDFGYMTSEELKIITGTKMKPNPIAKPKPGKKDGKEAKEVKEAKGGKARPAARAERAPKAASKAKKSKGK